MIQGFADDLYEPGMLYLRPILSTIPRGTITAIRTPEDFSDIMLFLERDIPGLKEIEVYGERVPVLSGSEVHYEGEAVCLICSEKAELLDTAESRVAVDYESDYTLDNFEKPRDDQFYGEISIKRGNAARAFSTASQIVEGEYTQEDPVRDTIAPIGALVTVKDGFFTVTASTLWPEQIRRSVAEVLGIPARQVEVRSVNPFPTDGEKLILPVYLAVWAALCCSRSGRPVRAAWDLPPRTLPFLRSPRSRIRIQSALNARGTVTGEKIEAFVDLGASPVLSEELFRRLAIGAAGSRYLANISLSVKGVRTSLAPARLRCGFGINQGLFAREVHETRIARILDQDPSERRIHIPGDGKTATGGQIRNRNDKKLVEMVCEASDFRRKHSAYQLMNKRNSLSRQRGQFRGIGISSGFTGNGFTSKPPGREAWTVSVLLDKKDQLTIHTRAGAYPGSVMEIWKKSAGAILGIAESSIEIVAEGEEVPGIGPLVCGQRLSVTSTLIESCCSAIKRQRFKNPLPISVKKSFRAPSAEVWDRSSMKGVPFNRLSWGACAVEVEIDPLSLQPAIRGIWCALDCGQLYHPGIAESEVRSALMKTIRRCTNGDALMDRRMRESGLYGEHELLSLPPVTISFLQNPSAPPSGISQLPGALFPAAFVSALSQAAGLYLDMLPLTPELIHSYLSRENA